MNELAAETSYPSTSGGASKWCSVAAMEGRAGERWREAGLSSSLYAGAFWETHLPPQPTPDLPNWMWWHCSMSWRAHSCAHVLPIPVWTALSNSRNTIPDGCPVLPISNIWKLKYVEKKRFPSTPVNQREDFLLPQAFASAGANCWTQLKV